MVTSKEEQAQIKTGDLMRLADWQEVKTYEDITYHKAGWHSPHRFRPPRHSQRLSSQDHRRDDRGRAARLARWRGRRTCG